MWDDARCDFVSEMVGICLGAEPAVVSPFITRLAEEWQGSRSPEGLRLLSDDLGLRERWNDVFDNRRAEFLADQVVELVPPARASTVLDILAGTGKLAQALRRRGYEVAEYERGAAYGTACSPWARPLEDLTDDMAAHDGSTVTLLAAVLHHESSPTALLRYVADAAPASPLLVFENPLIGSWTEHEHELFDWLFNRVINDFGVDTPGEYRTWAGWCELLGRFGQVTESRVLAHVPGLPFPYTAHLVERG
jgi:hypothetical protein